MIKLAIPDVGQEEINEIQKVFDSKYLVQGDKVEEFENMVKEFLNVKHVLAVSSGTAALHLALVALNIKAGDQVIVPDFTFPATANVVELVGAEAKFVDIKLDSFCIDVNQIEENITSKTKAILPVHEFGQSTDMDQIIFLAKKHNLKVIEDAACALGAQYNGKMVGTMGDIGCFSLHPRKAITTGEGGILVTNDDEIADKVRALRNHGLSYINGKAEFVMAGFNYRMTNIQGAIGIIQMRKLNYINRKREEIAHEYSELLADIKGVRIPEEKSYGKHVWQSYHILLDERINRDLFIEMLKEKGIEVNFGAHAVHRQIYFKQKYNCEDNKYKNSIFAYNQGLVLPLHTKLNKDEIVFISDTMKGLINIVIK